MFFIARVVKRLRVLSGDGTQNHVNQMAVNCGKESFFFPCDTYLSGWKICSPPDVEDLVRWGDLFCNFANPLCH